MSKRSPFRPNVLAQFAGRLVARHIAAAPPGRAWPGRLALGLLLLFVAALPFIERPSRQVVTLRQDGSGQDLIELGLAPGDSPPAEAGRGVTLIVKGQRLAGRVTSASLIEDGRGRVWVANVELEGPLPGSLGSAPVILESFKKLLR